MSQNNDTNNLSKHLKAFEPYIGKAYKGEFVGSTSEKPVFDVSVLGKNFKWSWY